MSAPGEVPRIVPARRDGLVVEAEVTRKWKVRDPAAPQSMVVAKGEGIADRLEVEIAGQDFTVSEPQATALLLMLGAWLRTRGLEG